MYVGALTQAPIAVLSLIHAVRISHGTRLLSGGTQSRLRLFQSLVLNLIVLFGGSTVVALLLGAPLPILISPLSVGFYSLVHAVLFFSGVGSALLRAHASPLALAMDLGLAAVDAVCRSEAIANYALTQVKQHTNPAVAHSLFAQLIVGALLSGGVPLLVGVFHLNSPTGLWSFGTPPWVFNPSLLLYPDLLGGAVVPLVFLCLTTSGAEASSSFAFLQAAPVRQATTSILSRFFAVHPSIVDKEKPLGHIHSLPYLSQREAKAVSALVLYMILALPIVLRHLASKAPAPPKPPKAKPGPKPKPKPEAKSLEAKSPEAKSPEAKAESDKPEAISSATETPTASPAPRKRGRPRKNLP